MFNKFTFFSEPTLSLNKIKQNERNIVFYSENENSMFIFKPLIDELTVKHNLNICNTCDKEFTSQEGLAKHMEVKQH